MAAKPVIVFNGCVIKACRFNDFDIPGHEKHLRILRVIQAVPPNMVLSGSVRLNGTRITERLLRVLRHQLKLQFHHAPYHSQIQFIRHGQASLDLEFMVHIRVCSRIGALLKRTHHITIAVGIRFRPRPFHHRGQKRFPVKMVIRILENIPIFEVQLHGIPHHITVRRAVKFFPCQLGYSIPYIC